VDGDRNQSPFSRGSGEVATKEEFYGFWRKHPWKIGKAVQTLLMKLAADVQENKP